MMNKILSLFKKQEEQPDTEEQSPDDDVSGSITYYFKEGSDETYIDVYLSDYEEESLTKFAKIIAGLSSLRFQIETLNMVKGCFQESDDEDSELVFNKIVMKMIQFTEEETSVIEQLNKDIKNKEEQPWIKPSDMIK